MDTGLDFESSWWIVSRLAAALLAGGILGINRDLRHKRGMPERVARDENAQPDALS